MIDVHEEVSRALAQGVPVVALETTIITHGLPYPANIDAACQLEQAIRRERAVPAIIGVLHGRVRVGMSRADLEMLTRGPADKIQARSLPLAISRRASGGTTVSATLEIARQYGIAVFATGGIGGVHRHVERTGDVSEDLYALAHSPVAVVSSVRGRSRMAFALQADPSQHWLVAAAARPRPASPWSAIGPMSFPRSITTARV